MQHESNQPTENTLGNPLIQIQNFPIMAEVINPNNDIA